MFESFIMDSDRIARRDYQPTDDDVIRARLRTLGVQEYKFIFDHGMLSPCFYFLYLFITQAEQWVRNGDCTMLVEQGTLYV